MPGRSAPRRRARSRRRPPGRHARSRRRPPRRPRRRPRGPSRARRAVEPRCSIRSRSRRARQRPGSTAIEAAPAASPSGRSKQRRSTASGDAHHLGELAAEGRGRQRCCRPCGAVANSRQREQRDSDGRRQPPAVARAMTRLRVLSSATKSTPSPDPHSASSTPKLDADRRIWMRRFTRWNAPETAAQPFGLRSSAGGSPESP